MKIVTVRQGVQRPGKKGDIVLEADPLAGLNQMRATYMTELGVVQNQVAELSALLHKVHVGKAHDLVMETMKTDELAQNHAGVIKAKGLVEITRQKILFLHVLVLLLTGNLRLSEKMLRPPGMLRISLFQVEPSRIIVMGAMRKKIECNINIPLDDP